MRPRHPNWKAFGPDRGGFLKRPGTASFSFSAALWTPCSSVVPLRIAAQRAAVLVAGALQSPGGDRLDQPDDPARRAAAQCDHPEGRQQERNRTVARGQYERRADQPEADRTAREVARDGAAGKKGFARSQAFSVPPLTGRVDWRSRVLIRSVSRPRCKRDFIAARLRPSAWAVAAPDRPWMSRRTRTARCSAGSPAIESTIRCDLQAGERDVFGRGLGRLAGDRSAERRAAICGCTRCARSETSTMRAPRRPGASRSFDTARSAPPAPRPRRPRASSRACARSAARARASHRASIAIARGSPCWAALTTCSVGQDAGARVSVTGAGSS